MTKEAQSKLRVIGNQPLHGRLESQQCKRCNFGLSELGTFAALLFLFVYFGSHHLHAKNLDTQYSLLRLHESAHNITLFVYLYFFCFCLMKLHKILTDSISYGYPIRACSQQACNSLLQYNNKGVYHHEVSNQKSSNFYQLFHNLRCHNVNIKLSAAASSATCVLIML